jgi:hypothetical protein
MQNTVNRLALLAALVLPAALALTGCNTNKDKPQADAPAGQTKPGSTTDDEVAAERAKLDPADRALVEAQEWCVVQTDERLGSMGPPLKLDIKGQPVFVCCKGCRKKAEADPDKTLAKVEGLKAKAKAEREAKK